MEKKVVPTILYLDKEAMENIGEVYEFNSGYAVYVHEGLSAFRFRFQETVDGRVVISEFEEVGAELNFEKMFDFDATNVYRVYERENAFSLTDNWTRENEKPFFLLQDHLERAQKSHVFAENAQSRANLLHKHQICLDESVPYAFHTKRADLFRYILTGKATPGVQILLLALGYGEHRERIERREIARLKREKQQLEAERAQAAESDGDVPETL